MEPTAIEIMREWNSSALIGIDDGLAIMIEDVIVEDLTYRMEVQSTVSGKHATAWIRHNPWAKPGQGPNAGVGFGTCHIGKNGLICLGPQGAFANAVASPYELVYVLPRAMYLCAAFNHLKRFGTFPQPR